MLRKRKSRVMVNHRNARRETDMTITQTIITAQEYAKRDAVEAACRLLNAAMAKAKRGADQMRLDIAKHQILDAAVEATVARSRRA
jgi:hypothetical protein